MTQFNGKIDNKDRRVKVQTLDGKMVTGHINILGFDRLSDYLLHHNEEFIMIYKGGIDQGKTIFIFKRNIVLIEDTETL
jgi:small nuclear ribonucleoprotein (snRNP)-like protein